MNKIEARDRLRAIIRDMLLTDLESDRPIPQGICDYVLETHGWTVRDKSDPKEDINGFVKILQKWIEDSHLLIDHSNTCKQSELDYDLTEVYEKFVEAESQYWQVTSELVKVLELAVQHKERYLQYFKNKCRSQESSMDVLTAKSQFLKLQFFLKLYGEEKALGGHLALQSKLRKDLEVLKRSYKEAVEVNKQYDVMRNDKQFCELFKMYKDLKKIEKRTEIIGKM